MAMPSETNLGDIALGEEMHGWVRDLFPICRSITGSGVRKTLDYLTTILPDMRIRAVPSGTTAFDWTVPDEWNISKAFIEDIEGNVLVDFRRNNLHVMGYSTPIDAWMTLDELQPHLHSIPDRLDTIPYVTSYYSRNWGFCLTQRQRDALPREGKLHVVIDSTLQPGQLNYGELILPGQEDREIFFSTYVCHPSMANNELSGPVVCTALARWVRGLTQRRYTYRFIFIPETIGSIVYLSMHHEELKRNVIAGFNLTCVGDDRAYSFLPSREGDTLADRVALQALKTSGVDYKKYSFLTRGSDERQYCWPGINLPIVSIMRSKYGTFPEYHTSDDDLSLVTPNGLAGALALHMECVKIVEADRIYVNKGMCEPNLGRRGLYPLISSLEGKTFSRSLLDFLIYCDGNRSLLEIAEILEKSLDEILLIAETLRAHGLVEE